AGLVTKHLVRAEQRRGATWYELSHDRLIDPARDDNKRWFDSHLSPLQREAALWDMQHRPNGLLLQSDALNEAEKWAKEHAAELTQNEEDFLEASRELRMTTRRMRMVTVAAITAIFVAVVAGLWARVKIRESQAIENSAIGKVIESIQR